MDCRDLLRRCWLVGDVLKDEKIVMQRRYEPGNKRINDRSDGEKINGVCKTKPKDWQVNMTKQLNNQDYKEKINS
jgi:hypothetical protein